MNYKVKHRFKHLSPIENVLENNGISEYDKFLKPTKNCLEEYELLENIYDIARVIIDYIKENKSILIIQDSDTDGLTSASMLWNYIKRIDPLTKLDYRIHNEKQHGLEDIIEELQDYCPYDLIILPDAGSADEEYYKILYDKNVTCIYIDHHEADYYCNFAMGVNNQLSPVENKFLSGAGVVYKVLQCMDEILCTNYADDYLDLAALGIVADCMKLNTYENRYIINKGLSNIKNPGFKALLQQASFSVKDVNNPTPTEIAWNISPLINSMVRQGKKEEKELMFRAFICDENERVPKISRGKVIEYEFEPLIIQSARNCANTKSRQDRAVEKSVESLINKIEKEDLNNNQIIFMDIADEKISTTLTGLLAMKIAAHYGKPVLLGKKNDEGYIRGSVRAEDKGGLSDFRSFLENSGYMDYVRGHALAFGFSIKEENVEGLINYCNDKLSNFDLSENIYYVDFEEDCVNADLINIINDIGQYDDIWGIGIPQPLIAVRNIPIKNNYLICGKKQDTLKISIDDIAIMKFKAEKIINELKNRENSYLNIIGTAKINNWNGKITPQIFIKDYEFNNILDF